MAKKTKKTTQKDTKVKGEVQTAKNWWKSGVGWGGMYAPAEEEAMHKNYFIPPHFRY